MRLCIVVACVMYSLTGAMAQTVKPTISSSPVKSVASSPSRKIPVPLRGRIPIWPTEVHCAGAGCVKVNRGAWDAFQAAYGKSIPQGRACVTSTGDDGKAVVAESGIPTTDCFATTQACLNSAAGICYTLPGMLYEAPHWRDDIDAGSDKGATAKAIIAVSAGETVYRVPGDDARTATWTKSKSYKNLWSMPLTKGQGCALRVISTFSIDSDKLETRIPIYGVNKSNPVGFPWNVAKADEVSEALKSADAAGRGAVCDPNNRLLFVGMGGADVSRVATEGGLRVCWMDASGTASWYILGTKLYIAGLVLDCEAINTQSGGSASSPLPAVLYDTQVTVRYGGGDRFGPSNFNVNGGIAIHENAASHAAFDDNFHCDEDRWRRRGITEEINSLAFQAGDVQSFPRNGKNSTPQNSSSHGGCDVVRLGATFLGALNQNIADTSAAGTNAYSWNVGVLLSGSQFWRENAKPIGLQCAGGTSGKRTCWQDWVQDNTAGQPTAAYGVNGNGSGVTMLNAVAGGGLTVKASVVCEALANCATYDVSAP